MTSSQKLNHRRKREFVGNMSGIVRGASWYWGVGCTVPGRMSPASCMLLCPRIPHTLSDSNLKNIQKINYKTNLTFMERWVWCIVHLRADLRTPDLFLLFSTHVKTFLETINNTNYILKEWFQYQHLVRRNKILIKC